MDKPTSEATDSLPRIQVRDMFMLLRLFETRDETTLENFRLRLCTDREAQRRGDYLFSTARDTASELQRLGLLARAVRSPKDSRDYARMRDNALRVTKAGRVLLERFGSRFVAQRTMISSRGCMRPTATSETTRPYSPRDRSLPRSLLP